MRSKLPIGADRIDRAEAAGILQCSREAVRLMEARGELPSSQQDEAGRYHYARAEVVALAERRRGGVVGADKITGALCADVFAMFEADRPFVDVVRTTKLLPATVRRLRMEFDQGYDLEDPEKKRARLAREQREALSLRMKEEELHIRNMQSIDDALLVARGIAPLRATRGKSPRGPTRPSTTGPSGEEGADRLRDLPLSPAGDLPPEFAAEMAVLAEKDRRFTADRKKFDKEMAEQDAKYTKMIAERERARERNAGPPKKTGSNDGG